MIKKTTSKIFYVLLALAILAAVASPFIGGLFTDNVAYAAETSTKGNSGVTYYRMYVIYEKEANPDGKTPVTFKALTDQIKILFTEAEYRYEKYLGGDYTVTYYDTPTGDVEKTLSPDEVLSRVDNMFEIAYHEFYENSYFGLAVEKYVSAEKNEEFVSAFNSLRENVRKEISSADLKAQTTALYDGLTEAANGIGE